MAAAHAGGARRCSFYKLGDGGWSGTVVITIDGEDREFEVEQQLTGWSTSAKNGTDVSVRARHLDELVAQLGSPSTKKKPKRSRP